MQMTINHLPIENTNLVIWLLVFQSPKSLFFRNNPRKIEVNCVKYLIICYTTRHSIILLRSLFPFSTYSNIIKPFFIIARKRLKGKVGDVLI